MNSRFLRALFCLALIFGFMIPVQAFNFSNWFSSLSPRSKGALYLTTAAVCAGVGYLAYKIWAKKSSYVMVQAPEAVVPLAPAVDPVVPIVPEPVVIPAVVQEVAPLPVSLVQQDAEVKQQEEVKERAAIAEIEQDGWKSKTFQIPGGASCVALGKNSQGDTIILVGQACAIYCINAQTHDIRELEFPGVVNTIKMLSDDQFIAQSRSHIRIYDLKGDIKNQLSLELLQFRYGPGFEKYDNIEIGADKQGKQFVYIKKWLFDDQYKTDFLIEGRN